MESSGLGQGGEENPRTGALVRVVAGLAGRFLANDDDVHVAFPFGFGKDSAGRMGFEPLQQEQVILQYVERYGRITRREAAGLCQITERQATYLLGKMVKSGKLKTEGKKRGTRYIMS